MITELKTAACYIRVSTDMQTEHSPESQLAEIQKFAKANGYIVPREYVYADEGISGRRAAKRPAFQEMIATAKSKPAPFSAILLWKFSRFARNQEEAIVYKSMLKKNNVDVISVSEPMDDSPYSTLIERIIEWMDEYYSIRLSGEVKRGLQAKLGKGEPVTQPSFGYNIVDKKFVINESQAEIVRQIFDDYLNGMSFRAIAKKLEAKRILTNRGNTWDSYAVKYVLRNPVYIGKMRYNKEGVTKYRFDDENVIIVDGKHEAIISDEVWELTQAKLDKEQNYRRKFVKDNKSIKHMFMLHGLLKCSDCGATLVFQRSSHANGQDKLQCCNYIHGKCHKSHCVTIPYMNNAVITAIENCFDNNTFQLDARSSMPEVIDNTPLIRKDELKLKRIKAAFEDGVYTLEEYKQSRLAIEEHINKLKAEQTTSGYNENELRADFIKDKRKLLNDIKSSSDVTEQNELLSSFIDHIVFDKENNVLDLFFYA